MTWFYNQRGKAEQHIKEGKNAIKWTKLSCRKFRDNAVRLQLHALAYNLANFLRTLALTKEVEHWSLFAAAVQLSFSSKYWRIRPRYLSPSKLGKCPP